MRNFIIFGLAFLLFTSSSSYCQMVGQQLFDNSKIHEIKIKSFFEGLSDSLTNDYILSFGFGQIQTRKVPYESAMIIIDGTPLDSIGIRQKGFNSWWSSDKKPMKIDINKYKDQMFDGLCKFNLHNGAGDPSFLRENISYHLLRSLGIKAPRTAFAKVYIDENYLGLYRIVEQIDNTYLDVNYGNHDGNLYVQQSKGSGGFDFSWISDAQEDYYESLNLENHQTANDWSTLIHFLDVLNHVTDANFQSEIQAVFDVQEYLQIVAFDLAINNYDWYGGGGRNYYLVEVEGKFHWLPWDYNLTWREDAPAIDINPDDYPLLIKRILNVPSFYDSFIQKYCSLLPLLASESFDEIVDKEVEQISELMKNDPFMDYPYEAFEVNSATSWGRIPGLKEFAAQRYENITNTLETLQLDCEMVTEVPQGIESSFNVYPVPAKDKLYFSTNSNEKINVTIVNSLGQVLLQSSLDQKSSLDIGSLKSGYYILKASIGHKMHTKMIAVQ